MAYGHGRARARGGRRPAAGGRVAPARRRVGAPARRRAPPRTRARPPRFDARRVESLIHGFVNAARRRRGLSALVRTKRIDAIARAHSIDMLRRRYFSHDSPEGDGPADRAERAGYECRRDRGSHYQYGLAENITMGYAYRSYLARGDLSTYEWLSGEAEMASRMVAGWMRSPGHRGNILEGSYGSTGVGVAISRSGDAYATQNFC